MSVIPLLPLFHRFNSQYFENSLTFNYQPLVKVRWSDNRLKTTAGFYKRKRINGLVDSEIILSKPILSKLSITEINSTLCHEMIHAWVDRILKKKGLALQEGGRVINLTDKVNKAKALQVFVRFFKKKNQNIKTIAVGDNYNDLDMLKTSDFPCLVFNDKFTLDEIPINNLITTNKPSPEGWADVIKMALVKINKN